jgi:pre-rRNA-processing protein IPI1
MFCEFTSLLLLANEKKTTRVSRGKARQAKQLSLSANGSTNTLSIQTQHISEYVVQLLRGESVAASQLGKSLTTIGYLALLPTIWALLNNTMAHHHNMTSGVLKATVDHALKTSSKSALKRVTIEFVAQLVLVSEVPSEVL